MKTKLTLAYALIGGILGYTGVADASTSFNFTTQSASPSSSSLSMTSGGLTVTETGVWANVNNSGSTVTGTGNDFAKTWIGAYSGDGLGVCNPNEQSTCTPPQHQVDNYNGLDFVLFGFNTAVNLNQLTVQSFGNPTGSGADYVNMSYAVLTSAQEASLIAGTLVFSTVAFTTETTASTSSPVNYNLSGTGQYVLIGTAVTADYGNSADTPDAFKIQDMTVTATPEPASFVLIGSGLLMGAIFGRRRRAAKK